MGEVIIKPCRDQDVYVLWSTVTDRPSGYGSRADTIEYLGGDLQPGPCPTCHRWLPAEDTPARVLDRADRHGSSDRVTRFGWWEQTLFCFGHYEGYLRRRDLTRAADLLAGDRQAAVAGLLEPM